MQFFDALDRVRINRQGYLRKEWVTPGSGAGVKYPDFAVDHFIMTTPCINTKVKVLRFAQDDSRGRVVRKHRMTI